MTTDAELLAIEIETNWTTDERGRLTGTRERTPEPAPLFVAVIAADGRRFAFGNEVPVPTVRRLLQVMDDAAPSHTPAKMPPGFERCAQLLGDVTGPVEVESGPVYLVPPGLSFVSGLEVVRSSDAAASRGLPVLERANWTVDEWQALLAGELGPWAATISGGEVAALCHTARLADRGAEAGVWTDPRFRGRGHAATATAAWASLIAPTGRAIFYSTWADNLSSQRVAARLGLREIGWQWRVNRRP